MQPKAEDYYRFAKWAGEHIPQYDLMPACADMAKGFFHTSTQQAFGIWWAGACAGRHEPCHKCGRPFRFTPCCPDCGYIPICDHKGGVK